MAEAEKKQAPNADKNEAPKAENKETSKDAAPKAAAKVGMLTYVIMIVVVLVLAGGGFFMGRIFAGGEGEPQTAEASNEVKKETKKEV